MTALVANTAHVTFPLEVSANRRPGQLAQAQGQVQLEAAVQVAQLVAEQPVIRGNDLSPLITDDELLRDVPDLAAWGSGGTPGIFPMCWPGPRSQAGAMNTNTVNPEAGLHADPPFRTESRRTALRRPVQDSVVAGVAAGLARYLGVDVMIIRLAFVVLAIAGGAGIPLYLAGLLLIPEEGSEVSIAGSLTGSLRSRSR